MSLKHLLADAQGYQAQRSSVHLWYGHLLEAEIQRVRTRRYLTLLSEVPPPDYRGHIEQLRGGTLYPGVRLVGLVGVYSRGWKEEVKRKAADKAMTHHTPLVSVVLQIYRLPMLNLCDETAVFSEFMLMESQDTLGWNIKIVSLLNGGPFHDDINHLWQHR